MNEPGSNNETMLILRRLGESFPWSSPETSPQLRLIAAGVLFLLGVFAIAWTLRPNFRPASILWTTAAFLVFGVVPWAVWRSLSDHGYFGLPAKVAGLLPCLFLVMLPRPSRHPSDRVVAGVRGLLLFVPAVLVALGRTVDNEILWWTFTGFLLALGITLTVLMYLKDAATIGAWAVLLAPLRMTAYAVLAAAFMLPSWQTWETTEKRSRVLVVIDVSPSVTKVSDDAARGTGAKPKTRLDKVLDLLTDDAVALLQKVKEKNPLYVYRLGTRLDDDAKEFPKGSPNWSREEWDAWARYDFKPAVLAGLTDAGRGLVQAMDGWKPEEPGTADWAALFAKSEVPSGMAAGGPGAADDKAVFLANLKKLDKRIEVARSIVLGTNVPDSVLALVNREAPNMVQGVIVISDGRSNLGSEAAVDELRKRATREKIPIFTVAVGEVRENVAIAITDLQAPDRTQPEEPTKITVGLQGVGLANQKVPVRLGLYLPGRDPKKEEPSFEIVKEVQFAAGDPPLAETEFTLDADELAKDDLGKALVEKSPKVGRAFQLKAGAWQVVARVARDKREVFPDADHASPTRTMQVIDKPVRVLLFASGPSREYQTLRTLLVRETDQKRAELSIYLQTEGGTEGNIVQDVPPERLLTRFPDRLDTNKAAVADAGEGKLEKYYNLDEYDLIVAFDPDWNEKDKAGGFRIPDQAIANVETWVSNLGGGLMYVAGPVHTFQLSRADETNRLRPLLNVLPVAPDDRVVIGAGGIRREPRRVLLRPNPESADLLKLEDGDSPAAGWERYFTGKDEYKPSPVAGEDQHPRRGFFSYYPVKSVKPGATTWAEYWDYDDRNPRMLKPFFVTSQPGAGRAGWLASGEIYRTRAENTAYFDRFWLNAGRFLSAKREAKASRGRVLVNKEFVSGAPVKVQARLLAPNGEPYPENAKTPKFEVAQYTLSGDLVRKVGIFETKPRKSGDKFDGYYQGQLTADPKNFPPGDFRYRVTVDVPDSAGDVLDAEFLIKRSDPELDNTRPDFAALEKIAGTLDEVKGRVTDPLTLAKLRGDAADPAKAPLAYRIAETDRIERIPQCFIEDYRRLRNQAGLKDIWDREAEPPAEWKAWLRTNAVQAGSVSTLPWWAVLAAPLGLAAAVLIGLGRGSQLFRMLGLLCGLLAAAVVYCAFSFPVGIVVAALALLLSAEWLSRKLLRLA